MDTKTLAIGCDHAGFDLKEKVKSYLSAKGYTITDCGCNNADSVDYPDFAHPVANAIVDSKVAFGILICGSGNGISMSANKHQEIRAALCWMPEIAKMAKEHNNANILSLPARYVSDTEAFAIVDAYINAEFEGGRHQRRIDKITNKQNTTC